MMTITFYKARISKETPKGRYGSVSVRATAIIIFARAKLYQQALSSPSYLDMAHGAMCSIGRNCTFLVVHRCSLAHRKVVTSIAEPTTYRLVVFSLPIKGGHNFQCGAHAIFPGGAQGLPCPSAGGNFHCRAHNIFLGGAEVLPATGFALPITEGGNFHRGTHVCSPGGAQVRLAHQKVLTSVVEPTYPFLVAAFHKNGVSYIGVAS